MNPTTKKIMKWGGLALAAITLDSSLYTVQQSQQAVVTRFGKPVHVILNPIQSDSTERKKEIEKITADMRDFAQKEGLSMPSVSYTPGLHLKVPFIDTVHYTDRRLLEWDGNPEQITSKDKKYLFVDSTARFYIEDPLKFFLRLQGSEESASGKLDDIIDSAVREQISKRDSIESIRSSNRKMDITDKEIEDSTKIDKIVEGREKVAGIITGQVDEMCKVYGMRVKDLLIKRIVYVDQVKTSVEDRMIAERERIKQKYLSEGQGEYQRIMGEKDRKLNEIQSGAFRKAEEIKGKADAEATRIYADSFSKDPEFYKFIKSLEVLQEHAKGTTFVIDKDNDLFRYLGTAAQK